MRTLPRDHFHASIASRTSRSTTRSEFDAVGRIATRQYGTIERGQIRTIGISDDVIDGWITCGYLRSIHRGVYAVGHGSVPFAGRCMAAVLAIGGDAHVTGAAAAYLRGAVRRAPKCIDVITTGRPRRQLRDVRVRHTRTLPVKERTSWEEIPTTTVARMLVDMANDTSITELAGVMHELEFLDLLRMPQLKRCAARHRTRRGPTHRRITCAIALNEMGSAGTQSAFERRSLDYLLEAGVPMPSITPALVIDGKTVRPDLDWPTYGITVELDGPGHRRRRTRSDDAHKTMLIESTGRRLLRVSHQSARKDLDAVIAVFRD